jgi:hypothetical protein
MGVCRQVLESLPEWWDLVPDQGLFVYGEGEGVEQNMAARSPSGDWAVIYLARPCRVVLDSAVAWLPAELIDPRTGERTKARPHGQSVRTPEGWEDAVFVFRR